MMKDSNMVANSGVSLPVHAGGVIVRSADGSEVTYTPEEWRHKQIMEKLDAIERRLARLEASSSPVME